MDKILQQNEKTNRTTLEQSVPCHLHIDLILMIFGRTELIIGASKATVCGESFGEVRFYVAPQILFQKCTKARFRDRNNCEQVFFCRWNVKVQELSEARF